MSVRNPNTVYELCETMAMSYQIEVVRIIGNCKTYCTGQKFTYENSKIINEEKEENGCISAQATIITNIGRLLFHNPLYVSCSNTGLPIAKCGNVIFKITKVERKIESG